MTAELGIPRLLAEGHDEGLEIEKRLYSLS